jgi:Flp pilus assembly protein TadG
MTSCRPTRPRRRDRPATRRGEEGAITVLVLLLSGALLATAGLVWDGGLAISGRQRAADLAEQAARAGADDLNLDTARNSSTAGPHGGAAQFDTSRAGRDACRYLTLAAPKAECAVTVSPTTVTVSVTLHTRTALLGLIGLHSMVSRGRASATAQLGARNEIR